jgi:hypothetical protein
MSTITVEKTTGKAFAHIPLFPIPASTFHSSTDRITLNAAAAVSGAFSIGEDAFIRANLALVPKRSMEELEWDNIVNTPHVRGGLRRLAAEARRQFATGETEEGGFAVE